ncbi:MAG: sulfate adenylyltransferase, partial [Planctomyces sp.]
MSDLIVPHGGLSEPVCCTVGEAEKAAFLAEAQTLTKVPVSLADLSSVYRFGDGTLSPLTGPMNSSEWNQVLTESTVTSGGKKYAWTIPIAFPVDSAVAKTIKA